MHAGSADRLRLAALPAPQRSTAHARADAMPAIARSAASRRRHMHRAGGVHAWCGGLGEAGRWGAAGGARQLGQALCRRLRRRGRQRGQLWRPPGSARRGQAPLCRSAPLKLTICVLLRWTSALGRHVCQHVHASHRMQRCIGRQAGGVRMWRSHCPHAAHPVVRRPLRTLAR